MTGGRNLRNPKGNRCLRKKACKLLTFPGNLMDETSFRPRLEFELSSILVRTNCIFRSKMKMSKELV